MYFDIFYPVYLFATKLIIWKNYSFLVYGFHMTHNQNKYIFLMSYNSSSLVDKKLLADGMSRHYVN